MVNDWQGLGGGYGGFEKAGFSGGEQRSARDRPLWLLLLVAGILIFLTNVPVASYQPGCWTSWSRRVTLPVVELAADYRHEVAKRFENAGIRTVNREKELLVAPWSAAASLDFDGEGVLNDTEVRAITRMIKWAAAAPPDGISPLGYVHRYPEALRLRIHEILLKENKIEEYCRYVLHFVRRDGQQEKCFVGDAALEKVQEDCTLVAAVVSAENWSLLAPKRRDDL